MKKLIIIPLVVLMLAGCRHTSPNNSRELATSKNHQNFRKSDMSEDAAFALEATAEGMQEVELGWLAISRTVSGDVKQFGQDMVNEHRKNVEELQQIILPKNIAVSPTPNDRQQNKINLLAAKTGVDFDKAYINHMVKDHKNDIALFRKQAEKGSDSEIRNWAKRKLPVLEHQLQTAERIQQNLGRKQ